MSIVKPFIQTETNNTFPPISRRTFLGLSGGVLLHYLTRAWFSSATLAADRLTQWAPKSPINAVEWRYVAGRVTAGDEDYGFVVSLSTYHIFDTFQLLVQRQNFKDDLAFAEKVYEDGTLSYDSTTATYTFEVGQAPNTEILASWQWDETEGVYKLMMMTPELTLTDVVLRPQGTLIAEGGDGDIQVGINGLQVGSDYHADWTKIEIGGAERGIARVDMQGLRLISSDDSTDQEQEYDHHWFAIAATLASGKTVWVSAWRIEYFDSPFWGVTIVSGSDQNWQIEQTLTEESGETPLQVEILAWQPTPVVTDSSVTGRRWRVVAPNNILDVEISVPAGQFIGGTPFSGIGGPSQMQEAVGTEASGTVMGETITAVSLVVAESTAEFYRTFLPTVQK